MKFYYSISIPLVASSLAILIGLCGAVCGCWKASARRYAFLAAGLLCILLDRAIHIYLAISHTEAPQTLAPPAWTILPTMILTTLFWICLAVHSWMWFCPQRIEIEIEGAD